MFSWLDEFVMDYQTGFLKKEKMSMKIFQGSNIATFMFDFLISSVKVFGFFCLKKEKFSLESLFQELPSL